MRKCFSKTVPRSLYLFPFFFIQVDSGIGEASVTTFNFCGQVHVPVGIVNIQTDVALLNFTSNAVTNTSDIDAGFIVTYEAVVNCGGTLNQEDEPIRSPNYPLNYPDNAHCVWKIHTTPGDTIYVYGYSFDIEYSTDCVKDSLTLYDSSSIDQTAVHWR